jgi:Sulfotransferase family
MTNIGGYNGHNLVFIVGCSRSGTTWLQRLLASHPKVRTGQESFLFQRYVAPQLRNWRRELERENDPKTATGRGGTGLSCYFQEEEFLAILKNYMFQLMSPMIQGLQPGELFLEKTPLHALFLSEIRELLPESRFIHIVRDPRDVVASLLAASRSWGVGWAPRRSTTAAKMWLNVVRAATEAAKDISPREFLEIRYEKLLASPERTLRDVAEFLGLQWDPEAIKNAIEDNKAEAVKVGGGTPIPVYGEVGMRMGSIARDPPAFIQNAKHGAWRKNLGLWDKFAVWYLARGPMQQMGYCWSWRDWIGSN